MLKTDFLAKRSLPFDLSALLPRILLVETGKGADLCMCDDGYDNTLPLLCPPAPRGVKVQPATPITPNSCIPTCSAARIVSPSSCSCHSKSTPQ